MVIDESEKDMKFYHSESINGFDIHITNMSAMLVSKNIQYHKGVIKSHGSLKAKINKMDAFIKVSIKTKELSDGRIIPVLNFLSMNLNIPENSLRIDTDGSNAFKMVEAIKPLRSLLEHELRIHINDNKR